MFGAAAAPAAPAPASGAAAAEDEEEYVQEEEVTVIEGWTPSVSLDLKEVQTGEEDEEELYSQRSKLYRLH